MSFDRVWEDQVGLNTQDEPIFETLPAAKDLEDRTSWTVVPETMALPQPLEWYLERDTAPLPVPEDREGYFGPRHFEYWLSGLETYFHTLEIVKTHGGSLDSYAELGSASGRVIRHAAAYGEVKDLWAFDINWRHIAWVQRYLPQTVKAVNNTSLPSLPLPDASIDCLSAMSVFSHVESFETAWYAEMRRVLRPNGLAILTFVTERQMNAMDETWPMYPPFTAHHKWSEDFSDKLAQSGKIVLRWHGDRSYSSNVVYSSEYLDRVLGAFFDILEIRHQFPLYQDCYILRPK